MGFCVGLFYSITQFLFSQELNNFLNSSLHNASGSPAKQLFMVGPNTRVDDLNPGSLTRARCMLYVKVKVSLYRLMPYFTCTYYFCEVSLGLLQLIITFIHRTYIFNVNGEIYLKVFSFCRHSCSCTMAWWRPILEVETSCQI